MPALHTRRAFLGTVGATASLLAGCTESQAGQTPDTGGTAGPTETSGSQANSDTTLRIAWVPIFPNMQHFVMQEQGYYDELGATVETTEFSSGPAAVKAFAADEVDVAMFGITPAMVLTSKGKDADVLAANSRNGFKLLATESFADRFDAEGVAAFEAFEEENNRKPRWGTAPDGSVPDILTRYWLEADLEAGATDDVVSKQKVPPAKTPQTIEAGDIDGTTVQEPFATRIADLDGVREIAWSGDVLPDHPVTAPFVANRVPDAVKRAFVEQHVRATEFIASDPMAAARDAATVIGVDEGLAERAMESKASDFLSNPHEVADQAAAMSEFVAQVGNIPEPMAADTIFDVSVYDDVA
jgi:NitT/TauT family transport system substrate-binding protein